MKMEKKTGYRSHEISEIHSSGTEACESSQQKFFKCEKDNQWNESSCEKGEQTPRAGEKGETYCGKDFSGAVTPSRHLHKGAAFYVERSVFVARYKKGCSARRR